MILDFIQQALYSGLFFLGIAGVGFFLLSLLRFHHVNPLLSLGLAYFVSLCLYTVFVVAGLFILPDKRFGLLLSTILYGAVSFGIIVYCTRKRVVSLSAYLSQKRTQIISVAVVLGLVLFLFFLQIYRTAILDEWLHRPVVQSFVDNGVFPLVNPFDPNADYIHSYHYGTQIIAAALQILFRLDVPASLDLFKLSYFIATFFLFYGLIYGWTKRWWLSLCGAVLILFTGSSFFFLDSFTASHLISFKGFELLSGQQWSINGPASYILSGITWVNIPLAVALVFLIDFIFQDKKDGSILKRHAIFIILLIGLFLISELFSVVILLIYVFMVLRNCNWKPKKLLQASFGLFLFGSILAFGVYATGGIVGSLIERVVHSRLSTSYFEQTRNPDADVKSDIYDAEVMPISNDSQMGILSLKPIKLWGYPSEKHILSFLEAPTYYLRSLLLELCILGLFLAALIQKKFWFKEMPAVTMLVAIGLIIPFLFSTSFGDVNLAKLLTPALVILHLFVFFWLTENRLVVGAWVKWVFVVLFITGSISGILVGPNIQWQLISGKGRAQYCSQNPVCYKGEFVDLLRKFEQDQPGLKHIQTDPKSAAKVVDLTNAYVYRGITPGLVKYVVETPELRKMDTRPIHGEMLYESGDYRIWRIN